GWWGGGSRECCVPPPWLCFPARQRRRARRQGGGRTNSRPPRPRSSPAQARSRIQSESWHHLVARNVILPTTVSGSPCTFAAMLRSHRPCIERSVLNE